MELLRMEDLKSVRSASPLIRCRMIRCGDHSSMRIFSWLEISWPLWAINDPSSCFQVKCAKWIWTRLLCWNARGGLGQIVAKSGKNITITQLDFFPARCPWNKKNPWEKKFWGWKAKVDLERGVRQTLRLLLLIYGASSYIFTFGDKFGLIRTKGCVSNT